LTQCESIRERRNRPSEVVAIARVIAGARCSRGGAGSVQGSETRSRPHTAEFEPELCDGPSRGASVSSSWRPYTRGSNQPRARAKLGIQTQARNSNPSSEFKPKLGIQTQARRFGQRDQAGFAPTNAGEPSVSGEDRDFVGRCGRGHAPRAERHAAALRQPTRRSAAQLMKAREIRRGRVRINPSGARGAVLLEIVQDVRERVAD